MVVTSLGADGWPARAREVLADALGRTIPAPPAIWADPDRAVVDAGTAGLVEVGHEVDTLDYPLDPGRDRIDQVTSELVALRTLQSALGQQWESVRPRLVPVLGDGPLRDRYVTVTGRVG